ncbi:outer membrane lipoprotein BlpG [Brachyspira hampsonii 30446]|uniref:Outer membrane lipoprotein BlpG n=2 Tax=Brachyspira hampsonii TaxID=1287055 RepID=A0A2U4F1C0_9SPIR|nr:MetQ/NlpA family ABC transporter substrate-binding protein [Brachyspira hampsonii]EKV58102.1 outer membrane lipoprotein BlpG [Brachyspira hampsonii 30446]OEJ19975.1 metal ABC transporter substrate-binding protein [Brachyspira hampsonii]
MKKIILFFTFIFSVSCSNADKNVSIVKVGYIGESDKVIWQEVMKKVSNENIEIELISYIDYFSPNKDLNDGKIDLNNFQHYAFFNHELESKGYELTAIADTCIAAMNIYSYNITNINQIKKHDKIAIPDDDSNRGRALKVLEAAGIIKLKDRYKQSPTINDIKENKLNVNIIEVDAGSIYNLLPDIACAVINSNFALSFGLNPYTDAIFKDNPSNYADKNYVNIIAVRTKDKDNEIYKKIVKAYQSDEVKEIYDKNFNGIYIAVW